MLRHDGLSKVRIDEQDLLPALGKGDRNLKRDLGLSLIGDTARDRKAVDVLAAELDVASQRLIGLSALEIQIFSLYCNSNFPLGPTLEKR